MPTMRSPYSSLIIISDDDSDDNEDANNDGVDIFTSIPLY